MTTTSPPWDAPKPIKKVLKSCLSEDPERRWDSEMLYMEALTLSKEDVRSIASIPEANSTTDSSGLEQARLGAVRDADASEGMESDMNPR